MIDQIYIILNSYFFRDVGGIPILVRLLQAEEEVSLSALGALRNLSYGQQNNINKV